MSIMESIFWHACDDSRGDELPDVEQVVLVKLDPVYDEPVWLGYLDAPLGSNRLVWFNIEGMKFPSRVTHWAEMPEGPDGGNAATTNGFRRTGDTTAATIPATAEP